MNALPLPATIQEAVTDKMFVRLPGNLSKLHSVNITSVLFNSL